MDSLWTALLGARRSTVHCWTGHGFAAATWAEVGADARRTAAGLRGLGVRPGTTVAAIMTNTPAAVRGVLAIWLAGGAVASLPVPARGMGVDEYLAQIAAICRSAGARLLLTDGALLQALPEGALGGIACREWESIGEGPAIEACPPGEDEPAFIQYSSGSTGTPKGCVLTPRAIAAQLELIRDMSDADPARERVVSWLPLSHDMGMFGCTLFPWFFDMPLVMSTPERFMFGGRSWFADLAEFGGTMTAGTNTALFLAARAQHGRPLNHRLEVRTAIIGAERVERAALLAASAAFDGLPLESFMPAYGMAEATLAVSASTPRTTPRFTSVDGFELAHGRVSHVSPDAPEATWLVGCGPPCKDVGISSTVPSGVGELVVKSPSLALGYQGDPELTAARFTSAGFRTGDLGFLHDGEVFPVGRLDEVISFGGRNVSTREAEREIEAMDLVHRGCAAVLDLGSEGPAGRLVLVAELSRAGAAPSEVADTAREAARIASARCGLVLDACVFLRRGSLPKTPSGKVQRHRARRLLLAEALPAIATVPLAT
ncbi:fatty-acyl-CoA synthase [Actinocorallia herbida]|uniref:Fatty-acyl-CoA synthase n=1 Tax=Actinocorallia herbida TaxID=58109 RepID=A0A3N1DBD9_9ACTN|nr:AMP-binding protein [Actinocorallia herbida]ROO90819.1 fatty-acyl-CoA synthase [Actinocorallia herbida]